MTGWQENCFSAETQKSHFLHKSDIFSDLSIIFDEIDVYRSVPPIGVGPVSPIQKKKRVTPEHNSHGAARNF